MGCIYTEAKNYPREPAAHVAISKSSRLMFEQYVVVGPYLILLDGFALAC